jgi:hypothetical protein
MDVIDGPTQSIEIDPELNRLALAEAADGIQSSPSRIAAQAGVLGVRS